MNHLETVIAFNRNVETPQPHGDPATNSPDSYQKLALQKSLTYSLTYLNIHNFVKIHNMKKCRVQKKMQDLSHGWAHVTAPETMPGNTQFTYATGRCKLMQCTVHCKTYL